MSRLTGRRTCKKEGHVYHVESNPPKHEGVCDIDGSQARPARRRQAGDGREAPAGLPRPDRADRRPLPGAGPAAALRRHAPADRGPRPLARDDRDPQTRRRDLADDRQEVPSRDRQDGRGRRRARPDAPAARGHGPAGRHDQGARRGGREVHPLAGRGAVVQGLPRLRRLDLRVAEPHGRPRHPGPVRARRRATSSRSTSG